MTFNIIHPSIVDLYVNALNLHVLQENLSETGPDGLTEELQGKVDAAASEFVISAKKAEELYGSQELVQDQLDFFSNHMQGEA